MKKIEKYPMGESQLAQIDCRMEDCIFHSSARCNNISPAITLKPNGMHVCWSFLETLEEDEA